MRNARPTFAADRRPRIHIRTYGDAITVSRGPCGPAVCARSVGEALELAAAAEPSSDLVVFLERAPRG